MKVKLTWPAPRAGWKTCILEVGADKVAAFIAEPVQGAGGVIIPPATYWPEIQRIVDQYGILLILDEVICALAVWVTGSLTKSSATGRIS